MNVILASTSCLILLALIMPPALSEEWPDCKFQCRANDVTVSLLWLGDDRGEELLSGVPGEKQSCYLWAAFHNNADTPRYAAILLADLYFNGTLSRSFYDDGLCVLEKIEPKSTVNYPIYSMIWTRGDVIALKRFVLSWGTARGTGCSQAIRKCSNRNTKCYGGQETVLLVDTPLSVFFAVDWQDCSAEVNFFDRTAGGMGPYAYNWDFGDGFHSQVASPTHTYRLPGNYTVRLLVRDRSGKEDSTSRQLVVNICPCTIVGQDHACLGKTETYRAIFAGLIPGSIKWRLDGREIGGGESREESSEEAKEGESVDIEWQDYGPGRHDLQVFVIDAKAENGPKQWAACNMSINVLTEPVATIKMVV